MFVPPEDDPRTDGGFDNNQRAMLVGYLADRRLTFEMKCADLDALASQAGQSHPRTYRSSVCCAKLARTAMADIAPGVPVYGALCFVDGELPMLGTLTFNSYSLLHPKALAKRINASNDQEVATAAQRLSLTLINAASRHLRH